MLVGESLKPWNAITFWDSFGFAHRAPCANETHKEVIVLPRALTTGELRKTAERRVLRC
jgi:hypothetical protein